MAGLLLQPHECGSLVSAIATRNAYADDANSDIWHDTLAAKILPASKQASNGQSERVASDEEYGSVGRPEGDEKPKTAVAQKATTFDALLGTQLLSKSGPVPTRDALADKKHVMLYFSAHW